MDRPGVAPSTRWTGSAGYETPIEIGEGVFAILERKAGVTFSLWHLNATEPQLRHVVTINDEINDGPGATGFHKVSWFGEAGNLTGEFIRLVIERNPKDKSRWDGRMLVGTLDLQTGEIVPGEEKKARFRLSAENAREKLLEKYTSKLDPIVPDTARARAKIQELLARRGLAFNYFNGCVHLADDSVAQLRAAADMVDCSRPDAEETILAAIEVAGKYLTCESLRDLQAQLNICRAAIAGDVDALFQHAFDNVMFGLDDERTYRLRLTAGYQILRIIATTSDDVHDYVKVAEKSMGLREIQDAAILRSHELLFLRACREATVSSFDHFIKSAPIAVQVPLAAEFAFRLAADEIDAKLNSADDADKAGETLARGLYTDWRTAVRKQDWIRAERCFRLLSENEHLKSTSTAVLAQDAQDRHEFENAMKAHAARQNEYMENITRIQDAQLQVMGEQLAESKIITDTVGAIGHQLDYISSDVRNVRDAASNSERSLELIRKLLD